MPWPAGTPAEVYGDKGTEPLPELLRAGPPFRQGGDPYHLIWIVSAERIVSQARAG